VSAWHTELEGAFVALQLNERVKQDEKWGGRWHDDSHVECDWRNFIKKQLSASHDGGPEEFERRMVKIAALAMAAFTSSKRRRRYKKECA
jgi:hypothetical protein